jgi:hypothetical protein
VNDTYRCQCGGAPATVAVGPAALDLDGRSLPYVEMDAVTLTGHRIELGMHGADSVALSGFGPRHDAFVADLDTARAAARRAALLQWTGTPEVDAYRQAPGGDGDVPTVVHLFADGLTVEPQCGVPELVPFGLLERVERDGYTIRLHRRGLAPVVVRRLGPRTDEFVADLERARVAARRQVADAFAALDDRLSGFEAPNGWAIAAESAGVFGGALAAAFAAGDRAEEVAVLAGLARQPLRYGLALQPEGVMPFVLVAGATTAAVEAVGDDARATYVFATSDLDRLNRALLLTSFRREALYLPEAALGRWSLAARTLPVVQWARSVFAARIVHDDAWPAALAAALR